MDRDIPLSTLVERGGIFYEVGGESVDTMLAEFIRILPCPFSPDPGGQDPGGQDSGSQESGGQGCRNRGDFKASLLKAALEREALMSTGIGRGVALPHPRNPLAAGAAVQFVAIAFPALPVDWKALDGGPVHSVLLIVSASPKFHLRTLSKINFLCGDNKFLSLLKARPAPDLIIQAIREAERGWN